MSTVLLPSCACLTVKLVIALFIKNAVIIGLLQGEPLAVLNLVALFNAFLEGGNGKGVNKICLALEGAMTFSGGTPGAKMVRHEGPLLGPMDLWSTQIKGLSIC